MNRHRSLFGGLLATLLIAAVAVVALPGAASAATTPPGGRANYTVALMRNVGTQSFVRLAQYSLRSDNSIRMDYWAWNAQTPRPQGLVRPDERRV
ncbi:hypothetical protein AB0F81_22040 [Actinoplanes sp. NPDC024001]|uniref:hypothetical protein n=1 Tax=Actinoplanes sp. NPDC024001 TaxID=3154598 RepID=UPI0033E00D7E